MIVWVDAQVSPAIAPWLTQEFGVEAFSVRRLTLARAKDREIFEAAREANAVVLTKDADFTIWLKRLGPPPRVIWLRCGNTSNAHLKKMLRETFQRAVDMLNSGECLIELTDIR